MKMSVRLLVLLCICGDKGVSAKEHVTIVNFVIGDGGDPFQQRRSRAGIDMALEKVREHLKDVATIESDIQVYPAPCSANHIGVLMSKVYYKRNVSAIIGPACSPAADVVGRMAASWNIPFLSPMATDSDFRNKDDFRSMTRLYYNMYNWGKTYLSLFDMHDWVDIAMIHESGHAFYQVGSSSLSEVFMAADKKLYKWPIDATKPYNMEYILRRASERSRVFVLIMRAPDARHTMLTAQRLGMTGGEYAFIIHRVWGNMTPWKNNDQYDKAALKAYESVVIIQPRRPDSPDFVAFEAEVKARSELDYNYTYGDNQVSLSVANYHDAYMIYGHALNETLSLGETYTDARVLNAKIWGHNFKGVSGDIVIDDNGDREMDFSLHDLDVKTGEFQVVANYFGILHGIAFETGKFINWPGSSGPPLNEPYCGFLGDRPECKPPVLSSEKILGIGFAGACVVFAAATYAIYRKFRLESELNSQWWKIKWEDITRTTLDYTRSRASAFSSVQSASRATDTCHMEKTGIYKGNMVKIKMLKMKSVRIDRTTLMELKQMRDIQCANLTRFLGLCCEQPNICVVTEHCIRGSLKDMLHNDAIKLDNDFKLSLLNDIIKGVAYIHASPLTCHGRLNTSNCHIDGRFVLKIADYGLKSVQRQEERDPDMNKTALFYVAPEILRNQGLRVATREAEIYSFAIMMLELLTRMEPYDAELTNSNVAAVLSMIEYRKPPMHPAFPAENMNVHLTRLVEDCWEEEPASRPSITTVKRRLKEQFPIESIKDSMDSLLKRLQQYTEQPALVSSSGKNILDTLLKRMEQYANNLEGLVCERTQAFLEEKRKADELLFEILPRSVANKLKNGQTVTDTKAAYEEVTVYFSDIVDFTVVDLLNDLYTCFDSIIDNFDVYKVETIGDAYMVVSGLPIRNGHDHARQISLMSLSILDNVRTFEIRNLPNTTLRARIGLHTGSVCAGVVGRKMPRYCLFGDTVNTASRMESNGEAMKIHISESTMCSLSRVGNFNVEDRGDVEIKGKGTMRTYWLLGEDRE